MVFRLPSKISKLNKRRRKIALRAHLYNKLRAELGCLVGLPNDEHTRRRAAAILHEYQTIDVYYSPIIPIERITITIQQ